VPHGPVSPLEIKLGGTVDHDVLAGLRQCMKDLGLRRLWVVTSARDARRLAPGIELVPWEAVAADAVDLF